VNHIANHLVVVDNRDYLWNGSEIGNRGSSILFQYLWQPRAADGNMLLDLIESI
jgi:hypothetical protein